MKISIPQETKSYKFQVFACALWFISLCLLHYFSLRPLWTDENFILNIIRSFKANQILGPLSNAQAFPRAYLLLVQTFSERFNFHILSLRLIPLICMVSSFFVWIRILKSELINKNKLYFLLILFSFATSYYMIYYAAELKHYSMDVLVVGIFCLYLVNLKKYQNSQLPKTFVVATFLLPFTILFSYSSVFIFWMVIYNFLFLIKKSKKNSILAISYTSICILFFVLIYYFDIRHTLSNQNFFSFWKDYFICTSSPYCFLKTFGEGVRKLVVWWFGDSTPFRRTATFLIPFFMLSIFGHGIKSFKENKFRLWDLDSIGLVIFLELFVLGILNKYPFTGARTSLFFAPFVFYFIVKGFSFLKRYRPAFLFTVSSYCLFILICGINSFLAYWKLYD